MFVPTPDGARIAAFGDADVAHPTLAGRPAERRTHGGDVGCGGRRLRRAVRATRAARRTAGAAGAPGLARSAARRGPALGEPAGRRAAGRAGAVRQHRRGDDDGGRFPGFRCPGAGVRQPDRLRQAQGARCAGGDEPRGDPRRDRGDVHHDADLAAGGLRGLRRPGRRRGPGRSRRPARSSTGSARRDCRAGSRPARTSTRARTAWAPPTRRRGWPAASWRRSTAWTGSSGSTGR